jgi:hypothetical protein
LTSREEQRLLSLCRTLQALAAGTTAKKNRLPNTQAVDLISGHLQRIFPDLPPLFSAPA